jgi:hypothetical protein
MSKSNAHVVLLVDRGLVEGTEDVIEQSKGTLGPDDETSKVATWSELEEVEPPDVDDFNTRKVAEGLDDAVVLIVDNKRTTALTVAAVPELSLAGTQLAGGGDLHNIGMRTQSLEEGDGLLGLVEGLDLGGNDKGNLLDLLNAVTTSENEGRKSGGSESRDDGESALVLVDLDVPLPPGLGGGEHATTPAHVTEGGLTNCTNSVRSSLKIVRSDAPGQIGEFLHHQHGEYERRHDRYPKTQQRSDDQPSRPRSRPGACFWRCSLYLWSEKALHEDNDHLRTVHLLDDIKSDGGGKDRREGEGGGSLYNSISTSISTTTTTATTPDIPPAVERTLTVGLEAIEDGLEGVAFSRRTIRLL